MQTHQWAQYCTFEKLFEIGIDKNEITPYLNLPTVYLTNEQHVLLSSLKLLITVRNGGA